MSQPNLTKEWKWLKENSWTKLIILPNAGGQLGKEIVVQILLMDF